MRLGTTPRVDLAEQFLNQLPPGSVIPAKEVLEAADNENFCRVSLFRAKDRLGIRSRRQGYAWVWVWPE